MATRTYGESCGIAHALDMVGERWAGLVVRELVLGPKRFTDLAADLSGASASVLSDRLRELERSSVVVRRQSGPPTRARLYALTPWGRRLGPILAALGTWALDSPSFDPSLPLTADAAALTLDSYFVDGDADWSGVYELRIGTGVFVARVAGGRLTVHRGTVDDPDAVLSAEPYAFIRMLGPRPEQPARTDDLDGSDTAGLTRLLASVQIGRLRTSAISAD